MSKAVIIYSHGFGVRKDDRGLFADIAKALPQAEHRMFDYGTWNEERNELTITSLTQQAMRLAQIINKTKAEYPSSPVDLVCHSQGCVVAAILKPKGIRKAILTAPPAHLSADDMIRLFRNRADSEINLYGVSHLKRADFSITNVLPEYWKSIENIDPIELYNKFSDVASLTFINAIEDEIIGSKDFSRLSTKIKVLEIPTGHNFEGDGRGKLIKLIARELNYT